MKTTTMVWILLLLLVLIGGGWFVMSGARGEPSMTPPTITTTTTETQPLPTTPTQANRSTSTAPTPVQVLYDGHAFTPQSITIAKGTTVVFIDTLGSSMWVASGPHPAHTGYDGTTLASHCAPGTTPSFDQCKAGTSYSFIFDKVGAWPYHDHANRTAFGKVVVQ